MNEIIRAQYLQAMGMDSYVSRKQLPGAALTRRLAIVRSAPEPVVAKSPVERGKPAQMPELDLVRNKPAPVVESSPQTRPVSEAVRFSLVAVFAGGIAWVESLDNRPLAREQVQLIRGMARAVHGSAENPRVAQFDWPMHNNPQLDQGVEAAKAGLSAFLLRHIDEQKCRAVVTLGAASAALVPAGQLGDVNRVDTHSTIEMLENPACKRQAWNDLLPLVLRA